MKQYYINVIQDDVDIFPENNQHTGLKAIGIYNPKHKWYNAVIGTKEYYWLHAILERTFNLSEWAHFQVSQPMFEILRHKKPIKVGRYRIKVLRE